MINLEVIIEKEKACVLDNHSGANAKKSHQEFKQVFQSSSLYNYLTNQEKKTSALLAFLSEKLPPIS